MSLYAYQNVGIEWLRPRRVALLADEMGLGKSVQALRALEDLPIEDRIRTLIVCPAAVRAVWESEIEKWLFFAPAEDNPPWEIRVASYDEIRIRLDTWYTWAPSTIILDEAHYVKSPAAQRTRALIGKKGLGHNPHIRRLWALTGTPAPSHAGELYCLARAFGLTTLSHRGWLAAYCTLDRGIGAPTGTKIRAVPELRRLFSPVMLRRHKKDVLTELPPIWHQELMVDLDQDPPLDWLTQEERDRLGELPALRKELEAVAPSEEGVLFQRLKALTPHLATLRRYTGLQKVRPTMALIDHDLRNDPKLKLVVFGCHRAFLGYLHHTMSPIYGGVLLDGATPPAKRKAYVQRFQEDPDCRLFLGNLIAAGVGITLTAAHSVILGEVNYVPGDALQACMRLHRIGQTQNVTARWVTGRDPLDRRIMGILRRKAAELSEMIGGSYEDYARIR